jgi:hypothetical protein
LPLNPVLDGRALLNLSMLLPILLMATSLGASPRYASEAKAPSCGSGALSRETKSGSAIKLSWKFAPFDGRVVRRWIGGDGSIDPPQCVVSSLRVVLDGREVDVPRAAYFDAYNPHRITVVDAPAGVAIEILASDGGGSAKITLLLRGGRYSKRLLWGH